MVVAPPIYLRISYWEYQHKPPGLSEDKRRKRRKHNLVSMSYNMIIWFIEALAIGGLVRKLILFIYARAHKPSKNKFVLS